MTKIAPIDPTQDISSLGVEQLQSLLQKATASDPCQGNCQMVEFTLKLKKRLSDLTELNRAQAKTLNEQVAELGKSKAEAEASLAEARAARALIEKTQAQTVAEIEAVGAAMLEFEHATQASLDELDRVLGSAIKANIKPSRALEEEFERTLAQIMNLDADRKQRQEQKAQLTEICRKSDESIRRVIAQSSPVVGATPRPQRQYQPQQQSAATYSPAYLRQAVHRPTPEQEMANALTTIVASLILMLGTGGIVLSSWLSNRQVLTAPVANVESSPQPTALEQVATAPIPTFYDPSLQATVAQVQQFDSTTRQAWQSFCAQTNNASGYSSNEQNFCKVLKFL